LGISASKFVDLSNTGGGIKSFLQEGVSADRSPSFSQLRPSTSTNSSSPTTKKKPINKLLEFMSKPASKTENSSNAVANPPPSTSQVPNVSPSKDESRKAKSFFENYLLQKKLRDDEVASASGDDTCDAIELISESDSTVGESSDSQKIDSVLCDKCQKHISAFEMPEHLDFHFAMELQTEVNSTPSAAPNQNGNENGRSKPIKRKSDELKKRGRPPKSTKPANASLTIDQFLRKQ
jgi:DNA polymerase eta